MADPPVIGHVIVPCGRCKEPRHIPVTCEAVPVARHDTYTWKVTRRGQKVSELHLDFGTLSDDHRCGDRPDPAGRLRLVPPSPSTQEKP